MFYLSFGLYNVNRSNVTLQNFETPLYSNKIIQETPSTSGTYFIKFAFPPISVVPNTMYYFQFYVESGASSNVWHSLSNPSSGGQSDDSAA